MPTTDTDTDDDPAAAALGSGLPVLVLRDGEGRQRVRRLDGDGPLAIGRRPEADVPITWDAQVSRLHAVLRRLAGEWTISDDGLSQNGTYVNEVRLVGQRRLADGDHVRVGRTVMTFCRPEAAGEAFTPLPGDLASPGLFSEQQRAVLRELCRPYAQDGEHVTPSSNRAIGAALGLPDRTVVNELRALYEAFELDDLADRHARRELARVALTTGIVTYGDIS